MEHSSTATSENVLQSTNVNYKSKYILGVTRKRSSIFSTRKKDFIINSVSKFRTNFYNH